MSRGNRAALHAHWNGTDQQCGYDTEAAAVERALPRAIALAEETLAPLGVRERATLLGLLRRLC